MKRLIVFILISWGLPSPATVTVQGLNTPGLQNSIEGSWEYIRRLVGIEAEPAPVIYLYPFDRNTQPALATSLQDQTIARIPELRDNPELAQRFFSILYGITYDADLFPADSPLRGRLIQVNPNRSFNVETGGHRGYGLYLTAHEMLHYALNRKGIAAKFHHCLMIEENGNGESLMLKVARDLIAHDWANETLAYKVPWAKGYAEEGPHCGADAAEIQRQEGAAGLKNFWDDITHLRETFL